MAAKQNNGLAVASLVLGIAAVLLVAGWLPLGLAPGAVLGVVGTVLGGVAKKQAPGSLATAGFVVSLVAMVLCALLCLLFISTTVS